MTRSGVSTLEAQTSGFQADIHAYIVTFLSNDARMKTWPQGIKDGIVIDISEKADVMSVVPDSCQTTLTESLEAMERQGSLNYSNSLFFERLI